MKRKLVLLFACLLVVGTMSAQKRVTGQVTDANGTPLAEAAVRVAGTKIVTYTDANGNFTLSEVPDNAKQVAVSLLGYGTQQAAISGTMSIVLQESETALEEAVVVGYGTARKLGTVVGTVTKVGSEKIENKPVTTALDALQGKVAGVQILSSSGDVGDINQVSTRVRGVGSLNGGNEPLFIVDGSPVSSSVFYMMNQNDIESFTVLRDASATSIYGSRAANGVVYVTTKKGRRNEKAIIKVGQSIGWTTLARRMGNPMNANELLDYQLLNGVITGSQYAQYKKEGVNTDWLKYYFKDSAPLYNTTFSVQGGSDKTVYYTSASFYKRSGLTELSNFERYTVRTNIESQATDWFKYGLNLGLNYDERNSDYYASAKPSDLYIWDNPIMGIALLRPYYNPYDANGNKLDYIPVLNAYSRLVDKKYLPDDIGEARLTGTAFVELTPLKGLTIRSQLGADVADSRESAKRYPSAPWLKEDNAGYVYEYFGRSENWSITNTIEYKFNIKEDHALAFLFGQEGIKQAAYGFSAQQINYTDDRLMELGLAPITEKALPTINSSGHTKVEYLSFFGRMDYGLRNKYFANVTIRNDRSSLFGKNNRSATFASGGIMWDAKMENFMKPVWWVDDLKVKVSVGSTGNSAGVPSYRALGVTGTTTFGGNNGLILSRPANEELGWETQIQTNFGLSTRIFNRANVELNYYIRTTKDMLMDVPVPYTTGFSTQFLNIGTMKNQGIELQFDVDVFRNWHGLDLNLYGNLSYNANKITKLFHGLDKWIYDAAGLGYFVGRSVNYYLPARAGVNPENGNIMWYVPDENGNLTSNTTEEWNESALRMDTGKKYYAPTTGGFGMNVAWKGLTLNADFAFVLGKWMIDNIEFFSKGGGHSGATGYNQDRDMINEWKKPGDITDIPRFDSEPDGIDTSVLHNASFMRMKNLSLSYDLPGKWMDATGFIRNVRFTAAARNLLTVTKWKGADPETSNNVARGQFPNTREFTLGIEVTF